MHPDELLAQGGRIAGAAGVYRYYDEDGAVLYVGKARNLKKRVFQLFPEEPWRHPHRPNGLAR
jgi:excinuclease ABC subunit C